MTREKTVYKIKKTISVSDGAGSTVFSKELDVGFNHLLKHIIIVPTTSTTSYKFKLTEADSTLILDRTTRETTGRSGTIIDIPLYGLITVTLSSVSANEDVSVTIYYTEP